MIKKGICIKCGTNKIDPNSQKCINGHYDWLTEDDIKAKNNVDRAKSNFNMSDWQIIQAIQNNNDLSD